MSRPAWLQVLCSTAIRCVLLIRYCEKKHAQTAVPHSCRLLRQLTETSMLRHAASSLARPTSLAFTRCGYAEKEGSFQVL